MAGNLTARKVQTAGEGKYEDGAGLRLVVSASGARRWVFRFTLKGKRCEMGLGPVEHVSLAEAREAAAEARKLARAGISPIKRRHEIARAAGGVPTFGEVAREYIEAKAPQWRSAVHARQWRMTLSEYCAPIIDTPINEIEQADVLKVLSPIWQRIPKTAADVRGRIEAILDAAQARHLILEGKANPASWKILQHVLPARQRIARAHHAAMPYQQVPALVARLRSRDGVASFALQFIIATGVRSAEALEAKWAEIDMASTIWIIPAHRMKSGREHRVPLSVQALEIIAAVKTLRRDEWLFPGHKHGRPISNPALHRALGAEGAGDFTIHGFRSAFRDWAGDCTHFARDVCEAALAHTISDAVEAAYRRGDALEKRRALMEAWTAYCAMAPMANVLQFERSGAKA